MFAVEATPFGCGINLSWKSPEPRGCPIAGYTVYYKENSTKSLWQVENLNNTDRHNLWLDCNRRYNIIVLAWNERGHSNFDADSVLSVSTEKGITLNFISQRYIFLQPFTRGI